MPKRTTPKSPKAVPVGDQIAALRQKAGLTSAALAEDADLGGISAVSRVENGRNTPLEVLQHLVDAVARATGKPASVTVYSGLPDLKHDRPGRSRSASEEKNSPSTP